MPAPLAYRPMETSDTAAVGRLVSQAFGITTAQWEAWLAIATVERFRVLASPQEPAIACLLLADLGQFFGGRHVGMEGVAGVAVAPEHRGGGAATRIMRDAIIEMHRRGVALSTLYAATQVLYRRVGYEQAGHHHDVRFNPSLLGATREDRAVPIRQAQESDWPRIAEAHRAFVTPINAAVARNSYIWERVRVWRGDKADGWVIDVNGRVEGHVWLLLRPDPNDRLGRKEMFCTDIQAYTPRAARRILAFLTDYSSMVNEVSFYGGPSHPLLLLPPEQRWCRTVASELWMLRVIDVERALADRGYAPGLSARVSFEFKDDIIEANNGVFTLEVEGGIGRVKRGGGGSVLSMDVRDLAPIYTGLHAPIVMQRLGRISGDERACLAAGPLFAGGTPWMSERF